MFATIAAYGDAVEGTVVVDDGYKPAGTVFTKTATIDWDKQKFVASIDVSGCTGTKENILSVGGAIATWGSNNIHFYYTRSGSGGTINMYVRGTGTDFGITDQSVSGDVLLIEISKENGITVNGDGSKFNNSSTDYNSLYSNLFNLTSIQVGSEDTGAARSTATYNYVRIQNLTEETPSVTPTITAGTLPGTTMITDGAETYTGDGSSAFSWSGTIDWATQKFVASIDVTNSGSNENILSLGESVDDWDGNIHFFYTRSGTTMNIYAQAVGSTFSYGSQSVPGDVLLIELSKDKGLTINGTAFNNSSTDYSTLFSEIFSSTTIKAGCRSDNGASKSKATYNYVRVVDKDTEMPSENVIFAETESDAQTTLSANKDKMLSSLTLTRTLIADAWNTFCVPFDITDISAFGAVKEFSSVSGSTMLFKDATSIVAGKPYLVKPAGSNIKNPKFVYATITSDTPDANVSNDNTYNFVGVYGQHTFTDDASTSYILVSGGSLVNPTENTTMNGMRAYFTYTKTGGVAPRVAIDGVETALTEVVGSEEITDGRIYNLRGMYVGNDESRLAKGIYIKNGKKVVLN